MLSRNQLRKLDFQDIAVFLSLFETRNARKTARITSYNVCYTKLLRNS